MQRIAVFFLMIAAVTAFAAGKAEAQRLSPEARCQASKGAEAGKYAACLHKAEVRLLKTRGTCSSTPTTRCFRDDDCPISETCLKDTSPGSGYATAVDKCASKFDTKWDRSESRAAPTACLDGLAAEEIRGTISPYVAKVTGALAGLGLGAPLTCGDGAIDSGEACDQSQLGGETCQSQGFAAGELACGAGCVFDTSSCFAERFADNADGTISDRLTGRMWAKQSRDGGIHDRDNSFTWGSTTPPYPPTGTAYSEYLATLNGADGSACFAGYCDWRLPTIDELQDLIVFTEPGARIDPIFKEPCTPGCDVLACSCTKANLYWSGTTKSDTPAFAWNVDFGTAAWDFDGKTLAASARAVR